MFKYIYMTKFFFHIFFISGVTPVYLQRHSDRGEQEIESLVKNIMWMVFIMTGKNH